MLMLSTNTAKHDHNHRWIDILGAVGVVVAVFVVRQVDIEIHLPPQAVPTSITPFVFVVLVAALAVVASAVELPSSSSLLLLSWSSTSFIHSAIHPSIHPIIPWFSSVRLVDWSFRSFVRSFVRLSVVAVADPTADGKATHSQPSGVRPSSPGTTVSCRGRTCTGYQRQTKAHSRTCTTRTEFRQEQNIHNMPKRLRC